MSNVNLNGQLCEVPRPKALPNSGMYASHAAYSGRHLPEASGALGSGGLERSDVDLGGLLTRHSIAQRHCSRRGEDLPSHIGMWTVSMH